MNDNMIDFLEKQKVLVNNKVDLWNPILYITLISIFIQRVNNILIKSTKAWFLLFRMNFKTLVIDMKALKPLFTNKEYHL